MIAQLAAAWLNGRAIDGYSFQEEGYDEPGNVFLDWHPDQPVASVCIMTRPGSVDDAGYGYDRVVLQFIVRGEQGGQVQAWQLADDLRQAFAGGHSYDLAAGVTVVRSWALEGQPTAMGNDDAGRPEYSVHVELEVVAPTGLRPLG